MNERLEMIRNLFLESLTADGTSDAITRLNELNPTTKELLTLAKREEPLLGPIGVCGTVCNNTCKWCAQLIEQEEEQEQRIQKNLEEILYDPSTEESNSCSTCGNECIPYECYGQVNWLCEVCYFGRDESTIGYCGFTCDGCCNTCGGSGRYDCADEV